jgi:Tfp pilus assembly protein PilN
MRQINLLPREILERRRTRQMTLILAAGIGGLIALLLLITIIQASRLSGARSRLERRQAENRKLQAQVAQLSRFSDLQKQLANKQDLLSALTTDEIRWSVILSDIATVIPADVWLTNLTGTGQAGAGGTTAGTNSFGQVSFSGCTLLPPDGTHLAVGKWLVRIGIPKEFLNPYLSLSSKGANTCPVNFSSTVSLSDTALRKNQRGGERRP